MTNAPDTTPAGRDIGRIALLACAVWTTILLASLAAGLHQQRLAIVKQAGSEAETIVEMDHLFRHWIIEHGNLYITATQTASSDTFLRAPDKEIKTPSGRKLMLVSHAYAMRQLSAIRARQGLPHSHITSLTPKDPANAPEDWEHAALDGFARGERETLSLYDGVRVRFIRAFRTEAACLACHASGGSSGGISIVVPLEKLRKTGARARVYWTTGHVLIWLTGLFGILFYHNRLKRGQAQREALLAELNETLAQVKYLSGLIPICASCKKIRNDKGVWESVEHYVTEHSDAKFSHGVCPDCGKLLYGEFYEKPPAEK